MNKLNSEDAKTRSRNKTGTVLCTIHQVEFSAAGEGVETWMLYCPICNQSERQRLLAERGRAVEHRDALLKAIEIKQLLTPLT